MRSHPGDRAFDGRRQNGEPFNFFTVKQAVDPYGVDPVAASPGNAGREFGAQALDKPDRAPIASGVFQINTLKFRGNQAHCVYCYEINRQLHGLWGLVCDDMRRRF